MTLTAAAVGTSDSGVAPNNITVSSKGNIVLVQQSTALSQLATPIPVAIFTPGGALNLFAGYTLSADGATPPTLVNPSATITSTTTRPAATKVTLNAGQVASVSVSPGSAGTTTAPYTATPTVTFSGGGGSGATGVATMSVSGLAITGSGRGYAAGTLPLVFSGGGGTGAAGTATISNGMVASVTITNGGSGYKSNPTWIVAGGTTQATGTTTLSVTGITVTSGGSGYKSAPTVTISPPGDDIYTGTYDINGYSPTSANPPPAPGFLASLVIESNTPEVLVSPGGTGGTPALITLADLTTLLLAAEINGTTSVPVPFGTETLTPNGTTGTVTITAAAITIDDLGQDGSAGTAVIPGGWSLVLEATGPIVFLDLGDTIATSGTGTITVAAGPSVSDVAALGNLTTGGGAITVGAGGNIALGKLNAGTGTVSATSTFGAILFSTASSPASPNITASSTTLVQHIQPVSSGQSVALAELEAAQVIAAADAASARAVAAADSAGAQAAAELASANAFEAALTSIQAAVTADNRTYQADVQITAGANSIVTTDATKVADLTSKVTNLNDAAGSIGFIAAVAQEATAALDLTASGEIQVPVLGTVLNITVAGLGFVSATIGLLGATIGAAGLQAQADLNIASQTLNTDSGYLAQAQSNEDQAAARLQADMDTLTAFAAAYDVAKQAYTSSEQAYINDQTTSAQVQSQGDNAQAVAIAGVVFASPPQPLNLTGSVDITGHSPLTVSDTTAVGAINLTAMPENVPTNTPGDDLTVNSGVTVWSTGSSVNLLAGDNVVIQPGATIEAASTITITANGNDDSNGATVTVAGTLSAPSASVGVAYATGNETFNIAPSATTPISVDGGSGGSGNTLNFNAEGLPVTISGDTITAGTLAPVTFTNIQVVNITNEAGSSFSVSDANGTYNGKAFSATVQINGPANLGNITPTLTYYSGTLVSPAHKLSGAPVNAGTYTVLATYASNTFVTALAATTFTIDPIAVILTGSRTYDGTTGASSSILKVSDAISGDTVNVASGTGTLAGQDTGDQSITSFGTLTLGNNAAGDYTLTGGTGTVTISRATLTVTGITASNKTYDGTKTAALNTGGAVLHGVASGDAGVTFDVSAATGTFASPDAGTGIAVQVAGITFDGTTQDGMAASVDYTLTQPTTTANISRATLTVTGITANDKSYDGTKTAALNTGSAVLHGVAGGDAGVTFHASAATGTFASPDVGTGIAVQVAGITFGGTTQDGTAASVDYTLTQPTTTAKITKANAVIVVTPYTSPGTVYNGLAHTAAVTSITGVNGETGAAVGSVTLHTTHTNAGVYAGDSWSFTGSGNYNDIASTTIVDRIAQAVATTKVTSYNISYDGNAHTATGTATGAGGVNLGSDLTLTGTTHTKVGTYSGDPWSFHDASGNYQDASGTVNDAIAPSAVSFIQSVYHDLLGRPADPAGLTTWTNLLNTQGNTTSVRAQVVADIEASPEYRLDEVDALYKQYLHRSAVGDPGAQGWANVLGAGYTVEQVAALVAGSREFIATQTDGTIGSWLNAFYVDALSRPVDSVGLASWNSQFAAGSSRIQIAGDIFAADGLPGSPANEYRIHLVNGFYTQYLSRSASGDPGSLQWASLLQQGATDQAVIADILGSTEYYNKKP